MYIYSLQLWIYLCWEGGEQRNFFICLFIFNYSCFVGAVYTVFNITLWNIWQIVLPDFYLNHLKPKVGNVAKLELSLNHLKCFQLKLHTSSIMRTSICCSKEVILGIWKHIQYLEILNIVVLLSLASKALDTIGNY